MSGVELPSVPLLKISTHLDLRQTSSFATMGQRKVYYLNRSTISEYIGATCIGSLYQITISALFLNSVICSRY